MIHTFSYYTEMRAAVNVLEMYEYLESTPSTAQNLPVLSTSTSTSTFWGTVLSTFPSTSKFVLSTTWTQEQVLFAQV